jgi:hypothetical protein
MMEFEQFAPAYTLHDATGSEDTNERLRFWWLEVVECDRL